MDTAVVLPTALSPSVFTAMVHEDARHAASTVLTVTVPHRLSLSAWHFTSLKRYPLVSSNIALKCTCFFSTIYSRMILPLLHIYRGFPSPCLSTAEQRFLAFMTAWKNKTTGHQIWKVSCWFSPAILGIRPPGIWTKQWHPPVQNFKMLLYTPSNKNEEGNSKSISRTTVSYPFICCADKERFNQILSGNQTWQ